MFFSANLLKAFCSLCLVITCAASFAQLITGQVINKEGRALPFATIKFANTQNGMVADVDGRFSFRPKKTVAFIDVSYLNYETQHVSLPAGGGHLIITLLPAPATLTSVVVKSNAGSKLRRILSNAITHRNEHNPDKYDWYRCNIYYKMIADVLVPDSMLKKDTGRRAEQLKKFVEEQHAFITETYSRRTFQSPAQVQDEVIASRMSGFKKALFSGLVTDVLPFHSYNNFIQLNGRDYYNPVSKGLFERFNFKLNDEILQDGDTLWLISFQPRKDATELSGTLYINSDGFAIAHLIAHAADTILRRDIGIEQQYKKQSGRWFPEKLNYTVRLQPLMQGFPVYMKGVSIIDSVTWQKDEHFHFDKAHTTKLLPHAEEVRDSAWLSLRPFQLQPKEARTYKVIDSVFEAHHIERFTGLMEKLGDGKFPAFKYFDVNVSRILSFNDFEKTRIGWGMQTNEKVFGKLSVGGWAGYGTGDKAWKYGGFAELYADEFKEFRLSASYSRDILNPGRLQINKEIDMNYLSIFLLSRVDKTEEWTAAVSKKFGYLTAEFAAANQRIEPQYAYSLSTGGKLYHSFQVNQASLNLRYAYGEITQPFMGRYYPAGTKYPIVYGRFIYGQVQQPHISFAQVIAAASWQKNINRFGLDKFLFVGAYSFSKQPLPLSKMFAGNGFATNESSLYAFGGMQTMLPYEYYSERFINFYWLHDFPFRFYRLQLSRRKIFSSAPHPSIGYNVLWGSMREAGAHKEVAFKVPDKPYHEAGVLINGLLRMSFLGSGYASLKAGYFYHFSNHTNEAGKVRFVMGLGFEL